MIKWSHQFEVGIGRIDTQHKAFLQLVSEYRDALERHASMEELADTLNEVGLYARFHFTSEENVMKRCNYPFYKEHCQQHIDLIAELNNRIVGMGVGLYTPKSIDEFLVGWFAIHTAQSDRKIGDYMKTLRPH